MVAAIYAILTPIAAIALGVIAYVGNVNYWREEFYRYNVYSNFGNFRLVDVQAQDLSYYLLGDGGLDQYFYNEKEKQHLADVKLLLARAEAIFWVNTIVLSLFSFFYSHNGYKERLAAGLMTGAYSLLTIVLGTLIFGVLSFSNAFEMLHKIFFTNDLYILDPSTDNLIRMFPQDFFIDTILRIDLALIAVSFVLYVASLSIKKLKSD